MGKSGKKRLDILLVEKGLFSSRERAKASIMAGLIYVDGQIADKPGTEVAEDSSITVKEELNPYVSRGGLKLKKLLDETDTDLTDKVCMDIGASTGGFTDCMLKHGARKVYAVDVGYGQLDWKLRNDKRVVNMEKENIRYLDTDKIEDDIDFISIDVSFISLKLVFPIAVSLLKDTGIIACLIKPQFEAGREQVGKGGIVRDKKVHEEVLTNVISYGAGNGIYPAYLSTSPIKGAKGNTEFLAVFTKKDNNKEIDIKGVVNNNDII